MLNDATCFKTVYIVCGYTDLCSRMNRLAALAEARTGDRPYVPDGLLPWSPNLPANCRKPVKDEVK